RCRTARTVLPGEVSLFGKAAWQGRSQPAGVELDGSFERDRWRGIVIGSSCALYKQVSNQNPPHGFVSIKNLKPGFAASSPTSSIMTTNISQLIHIAATLNCEHARMTTAPTRWIFDQVHSRKPL